MKQSTDYFKNSNRWGISMKGVTLDSTQDLGMPTRTASSSFHFSPFLKL